MLIPAHTIWDIKVQSVCGILSAADGNAVEIFLSGNFGQVSLSPPRVAINPNRLYPIEAIIRQQRRFAINVLSASQRELGIRVGRLRRRSLNKPQLLNLALTTDPEFDIPHLTDCLHILFCEVEQVLDTGDHALMIARVLGSKINTTRSGELPLLYPEISGRPARYPRLAKARRMLVALSGVKKMLRKLRGSHEHPSTIADN